MVVGPVNRPTHARVLRGDLYVRETPENAGRQQAAPHMQLQLQPWHQPAAAWPKPFRIYLIAARPVSLRRDNDRRPAISQNARRQADELNSNQRHQPEPTPRWPACSSGAVDLGP